MSSDITSDTNILDFEEEFDPLEIDDSIINQEDMDDDNPYDTVDYPTMREMPIDPHAGSRFTPETLGTAKEAMLSLFDHNPSRRPVLLEILNLCKGGCKSTKIKEFVDAYQENNRSVYGASTLCRMLKSAGGLELEEPTVSDAKEDIEEGVEYLEIKERVDPVWTTTPAGEEIYEEETQGRYFWEIMERDGKYLSVYCDVLAMIAECPRQVAEVGEYVDTLEVCRKPRRFGGHFIDMLERTDAIIWKDRAWTITELGLKVLPELSRKVAAKEESNA